MNARVSIVTRVALLTTLTSSLVYGLSLRHPEWDGMVAGKGASKIRGTVNMVGGSVSGTTDVSVNYAGDVAGAARPWHIHVGTCAKSGAVLGDAKAYGVLRASAKGAAEGNATLRIALPDTGEYHVNIHQSVAKMGTIVACGALLLAQ